MDKEKLPIFLGDTITVNTYGYQASGFIMSHFMSTRDINTNALNILSWCLLEKNNKFVFFSLKDLRNTTRIVLFEKQIKSLTISKEFNEDFTQKMHNAYTDFKQRRYMRQSRQIGINFSYQSAYTTFLGIPNKDADKKLNQLTDCLKKENLTIICGESK